MPSISRVLCSNLERFCSISPYATRPRTGAFFLPLLHIGALAQRLLSHVWTPFKLILNFLNNSTHLTCCKEAILYRCNSTRQTIDHSFPLHFTLTTHTSYPSPWNRVLIWKSYSLIYTQFYMAFYSWISNFIVITFRRCIIPTTHSSTLTGNVCKPTNLIISSITFDCK